MQEIWARCYLWLNLARLTFSGYQRIMLMTNAPTGTYSERRMVDMATAESNDLICLFVCFSLVDDRNNSSISNGAFNNHQTGRCLRSRTAQNSDPTAPAPATAPQVKSQDRERRTSFAQPFAYHRTIATDFWQRVAHYCPTSKFSGLFISSISYLSFFDSLSSRLLNSFSFFFSKF